MSNSPRVLLIYSLGYPHVLLKTFFHMPRHKLFIWFLLPSDSYFKRNKIAGTFYSTWSICIFIPTVYVSVANEELRVLNTQHLVPDSHWYRSGLNNIKIPPIILPVYPVGYFVWSALPLNIFLLSLCKSICLWCFTNKLQVRQQMKKRTQPTISSWL